MVFAGASVYMLPPGDEKDAQRIGDAICKHGVTTVHFVPTMFSSFLSYAVSTLMCRFHPLRRVFTSGEALETIHVERFFSLCLKIWKWDFITCMSHGSHG